MALNEPLKEPLSDARLRELCRAVLSDGELRFTRHARERMQERDLDETDIANVLRGGVMGKVDHENGSWRYELRTPRISAVVALRSETVIIVVTAWRSEP